MESSLVLKRYRIWCVTDSKYVFAWSATDAPHVCPDSESHEVDASRPVVVETLSREQTSIANLPVTPYDRLLCGEETVVIDVKPGIALSRLRDRVDLGGSGMVTCGRGAASYRIEVFSPGDHAELRTLERGPYVSGLCSESGVGGRLLSFPQADQVVTFGAYDSVAGDGFLFEISATGLAVLAKNDGVETMRTSFQNFNVDSMDGNGPSRLVLDRTRGYVWTIKYTSYGYGQVEFSVAAENIDLQQHLVPLHRYYARDRPSTACAYLPVCARIDYGASEAEPLAIEVTGRKHSVLGKYDPDVRDTCVARSERITDLLAAAGDGTQNETVVTVFAIRRRPGELVVPVQAAELELCVGNDVYRPIMFELVTINPREANAVDQCTWTSVPGIPEAESVLQYTTSCTSDLCVCADTSAVSTNATIVLWRGFVYNIPRIVHIDAAVAEDEVMAIRMIWPSDADAPPSECFAAVSLRTKEVW